MTTAMESLTIFCRANAMASLFFFFWRAKVRVTDLSCNKKGPLITRACSDAITVAEVASFGTLSPEGMTADLPPRSVAFAIVSFSPAQSSISSLLPLGLTAQIEDDMGKLEVQTTHVLKKA
jgi:hypothetical protein